MTKQPDPLREALTWAMARLDPFTHEPECSPLECRCGFAAARAALAALDRDRANTDPLTETWLTDAIRESLDANNAFEYDGNKDVMAEAIAHDIAESFARAALHVTDTAESGVFDRLELDRLERMAVAWRVSIHKPHDQAGAPIEGFPTCGAIQTLSVFRGGSMDKQPDPLREAAQAVVDYQGLRSTRLIALIDALRAALHVTDTPEGNPDDD